MTNFMVSQMMKFLVVQNKHFRNIL